MYVPVPRDEHGSRTLCSMRGGRVSGGLVETKLRIELRVNTLSVHGGKAADLADGGLVNTLAPTVALVRGESVAGIRNVEVSHDLVTGLLRDDRRGGDRGRPPVSAFDRLRRIGESPGLGLGELMPIHQIQRVVPGDRPKCT